MKTVINRRRFLAETSRATAAVIGMSGTSLGRVGQQSSPLPDLPPLEGVLLYDDAALGTAAEDQGTS
jgi:hypothetical protein